MNLHVFSLCEHRAGAPSVDGLDTVRLEGAPPLSADVSGDTPIPRNWGDSLIESGEVPVIVGTGACGPGAGTGNRNDVTQLMPLIQAIPPIRGRPGRPRQRPAKVYADRGYDHDKYRAQVRPKGITPVIARRSTPHGSGLGTYRWVVEQSIALLHWFRRLRIRWEIRDGIHEAFLSLACAIICWRPAAQPLTLLGPLNAPRPGPVTSPMLYPGLPAAR
jgi:hypothetical protein